MTDDTEIIRTAARAFERDRYLSALLAPRATRADLVALAAFAGEVARVPSYVSDPLVGEIRLQWWRDALAAGLAGETTGHPIADAVTAAARRHRLPEGLLLGVIDAQTLRLGDAPPADDQALGAYLVKSQGALFALAWRVLAGPDPGPEPGVLVAGARAYGLARLIVEFPALLAEGRTLLPETRLVAAGISLDALPSAQGAAAGAAILRALAETARGQLAATKKALKSASSAASEALLPVALVEPYLRVQEKRLLVGSGGSSDISPLARVWHLWCAHRFRRF